MGFIDMPNVTDTAECIAKIKENSGTVIFEEEDGVVYQTLTFCTGGEQQ